jgi:hypothetical protein
MNYQAPYGSYFELTTRNFSSKHASSMLARDPFTHHSVGVDAVVELERHEPEPEPGMWEIP